MEKEKQIAEISRLRLLLDQLERRSASADDYDDGIQEGEREIRALLSRYSADDSVILSTEHRLRFSDCYYKYSRLKLALIRKFGDPLGDDALGIDIPELNSEKKFPQHQMPEDDHGLSIRDILDQR